MEEYLGKICSITVSRNGKDLFYNAEVNGVSDIHISFKDKYGKQYTYRKEDIIEINENRN